MTRITFLLFLGALIFPAIAFAQTSADFSAGNVLAAGVTTPPPTTINLTADNQVVTVGTSSYLKLSSNNATSTNRTFCLTAGAAAGQYLIIEVTAQTAEIQDNANPCGGAGTTPNLSTLATFGVEDTLQLIYNGSKWLEVARSNN